VRAALGGTINDVFLACVAGSERRYFERAGSPPGEAMVATMPLVVTPPAERPQPGNYSSIDYVWLHAEIADPLERLRATSVAAEATKEPFAQTKDADIGALVELQPGRVLSALARSNVPGPREPRYLGRWRVDYERLVWVFAPG
jgi:diacylglycerol O-acyltransferase